MDVHSAAQKEAHKIAKVVSVGSLKGFGRKSPILFLTIRFDGKRLSISGVEGPKRNGDAEGGCGQVIGSLDQILSYEPGFNAEVVARLRSIWSRWHLNDMRAGCEHQRDWETDREVEIVTYKLTSEATSEAADAKRKIDKTARKLARSIMEHQHNTGAVAQYLVSLASEIEQSARVADLPYWANSAPDADSVGSGRYEVEKRENKRVGHLSAIEHPQGLLSKPCEVCGYKYGTEWRTETVPMDVIDFLESLPATTLSYPWRPLEGCES